MNFSIVIPTHNDQNHIERAVHSSLGQPLVVEVIVVDDGSDDNTPALVDAIIDDRLRLIQQPNTGPAAARNAGAAVATGTHLVFLDSDDYLIDGATLTFASAGDEDLIRSGAIIENQVRTIKIAAPDSRSFPRGTPVAGSFAIRRSLFSSIGGYDSAFRFGENSEMLLRAQAAITSLGSQPAFIGAATVVWERAPVRSGYHSARLEATELMLSKHRDLLIHDKDAWHDHCAIASELHRQRGERRAAVRLALRAVRARPRSLKTWARAARAAATPASADRR